MPPFDWFSPDEDDYTETMYVLVVDYTDSPHAGHPAPCVGAAGVGYPHEAGRELETLGYEHKVRYVMYLVPEDDFDERQVLAVRRRGYRAIGPASYDCTPEEVAKVRAAAQRAETNAAARP
ncbi:hypothetical protein ACOZ38_24990 [Sphaerisporangium viridialbum]|uniref:hypothetical protein n=1 Tax=Sphaerisporangium viridialbum TaxID=46189 RepID=UPI003C73723D